MPTSSALPPAGATLADLQAGLAAGAWTARDLVEYYLARIAALDGLTRAVVEVNPEARAIAEACDAERQAGRLRGPLHGIPVLLKDNIDTADQMQTTAGSLALVGVRRAHDAAVVARLRAAGAVILGKTNLSEWANFRSTRSVSGWSARGGQTRNPYALDRNPSGSSSGSAVAVAADFCAVAVGTETDGSIVSPSAVNGIVGLKPTLGLVSRAGVIPIAASQDTAGPMGRTVADAAVLLGVLAGPDPADPLTLQTPARVWQTDYTACLHADGLRGARLGVVRSLFGRHPAVAQLVDAALDRLRELGATVIDPVSLVSPGDFGESEFSVLLYEFKAGLNAYLGALDADAPVRSLEELSAFNRERAAAEMPFFGQELVEQALAKGSLDDADYREALAANHRLARTEGIDATLQAHQLDALIAPTNGPAWLIDPVNGDQYTGGCSSPAAVAGYPHITVPLGFVMGLPIGLSFFSGAFTEPTLLRLAFAFEQATQARRPPTFAPSAAIG